MPEEFDLDAAMSQIAAELPSHAGEDGTSPPQAPGPAAPAPAGAAPQPRAYPKTWKPEHASLWDSLPETHTVLKDEALRREDDFHKGIEGYKTRASLGERWERVLSPYADAIREHNVDPEQVLTNLLRAQMDLVRGGDGRTQMLRSMFTDYKIDPASIWPELKGASGEPPYADPALTALAEKVNGVESMLTAEQQRRNQELRERITGEVQAFFKDPKNDLAALCAGEISMLVKANPKMTLEEAYKQAIWMNPESRAKQLEKQAKADAEAAEKAEREKAAKAAEASRGSHRQNSRPSSATAPAGTIDETMRETLKSINSRSH